MKTSKNGIAFIEKEEGVILYAYDDMNEKRVPKGGSVKGTLTIGTGHTSAAGLPRVVPGMTITKEQADEILAQDLAKVEDNINNLVKVSINQNQFDALVSFDFNTGGLVKSSVLRKLNNKDYQGAADALLNWSKANGNPTLLLPRRQRERALFLTPSAVSTTPSVITGTVVTGAAVGASYWQTGEHWVRTHIPQVAISTIAVGVVTAVIIHLIRKYRNV